MSAALGATDAAANSEMTTDHWITVQHTPREYPF
jgi:hypothetical protein